MKAKQRLLLVDNDREFIREMRAATEKAGFEILTCHSAREARQIVEYDAPDLVIAEVMLEHHDAGFDLARRIKGDPRSRHIPVILLTDLARKTGYEFDFEKDGYWMKADDYVEKPLPAADLLSRINRLLKKGSEAR